MFYDFKTPSFGKVRQPDGISEAERPRNKEFEV